MNVEPTQLIALILGSSVLGGVITKLLDWAKDWRTGAAASRRAEVETAMRELSILRRWARILEESLHLHRRNMIDAPCIDVTDPEQFPPYPSRPKE